MTIGHFFLFEILKGLFVSVSNLLKARINSKD